jgi:hypothetical protein
MAMYVYNNQEFFKGYKANLAQTATALRVVTLRPFAVSVNLSVQVIALHIASKYAKTSFFKMLTSTMFKITVLSH